MPGNGKIWEQLLSPLSFSTKIERFDCSAERQNAEINRHWEVVWDHFNAAFEQEKSAVDKQQAAEYRQKPVQTIAAGAARIPSSSEMQKYENLSPGFTDRVLTRAEQRQADCIEKSRAADDKRYAAAKRYQIITVVATLCATIAAVYAINKGFAYTAAIIMGATTLPPTLAALMIERLQGKDK